MQVFDAQDDAGKRMRLAGSLRSRGAQTYPGGQEDGLAASGKPAGWKDCSEVMQMPDDATRLIFRYSLQDEGKVWSDGLRAVEVGRDVPLTQSRRLPDLLPCDIAEQFKADGVALARCELGFRF